MTTSVCRRCVPFSAPVVRVAWGTHTHSRGRLLMSYETEGLPFHHHYALGTMGPREICNRAVPFFLHVGGRVRIFFDLFCEIEFGQQELSQGRERDGPSGRWDNIVMRTWMLLPISRAHASK